jgi:hypothetical protein
MLAASLVSFVIYCSMWVDWVQDFKNGIYARHYLEALIETIALVGYTYLGGRFAYSRLNML